MLKIRLVCGTRLSEADFYEKSALGRSLRLAYGELPHLELSLFPGGNPGLPVNYNQAIRDAAALLFIHDDVHLLDLFWPDRLYLALEQFPIVGLVGSRRRLPRQPDGVFLAARSDTLIENGLLFDERFAFDCWDLDFCRQAELKGVTVGTTPIGALHESIGKYRTPAWSQAFQAYCAKWGE